MRGLRLLFTVPAVLLLGADGFRGCGEGTDVPDDAPLPIVPAECTVDADCVSTGCAVIECILGECVEVAPLRDDDGDGHAPPPCGGDCDDARAETSPEADEACNGIDDDCDGAVDDGAPAIDSVYSVPSAGPMSIVLPWGDRLLVTVVTRSAIWGLPVTIGGTLGVPEEIMRLSMGSRFAQVSAAAHRDGRILLVASTDTGYTSYLVFRRGADGLVERVSDPAPMDTPFLTALEVVPFGAEFAIGYEGETPTGGVRAVTFDPATPPSVVAPILTEAVPFGFATDGTHVVLTDELGFARFYLPDGSEVAAVEVPNVGRVARPLASWEGAVMAGFADAFDFVLAPIDTTAGIGTIERAPAGAGDVFEIFTTLSVVYAVRTGAEGTLVTPLAPDLVTRVGGTLGVAAPGSTNVRVSVAEAAVVVGVLGAADTGGQLAILGACGG